MSGVLVLDSEGLAKAVQRDREIHEWLTAARDADLRGATDVDAVDEAENGQSECLRFDVGRLRRRGPAQLVHLAHDACLGFEWTDLAEDLRIEFGLLAHVLDRSSQQPCGYLRSSLAVLPVAS
ncbi:hypothetical protein SHKM778_01720 [Streptomyces sp. KM77-8]|uniref:Uncharacterized protein n=1 Tax=Streptomyces haneummycinicus TaxID=3074435 RepID=A0AAT9H8U9_9ACTN